MTDRVLMVALDAFEITWARRGIEEGWLPTLAELVREGVSLPLDNPMPELPGSAWANLIHGCGPLDHEMIFDRQLQPGSYRIVDFPSEAARRPPFWRYISDNDLSSTIAGVYGSRLIDDFKGTQVVAWGSYDPFSTKLSGPRSDPSWILHRLDAAVPQRRSGLLNALPLRNREYKIYRDTEIKQLGYHTEGLKLLQAQTEWDFFFAGYNHPHEAGHLLWHRPDDLRKIYEASDRELALLLEGLEPNTSVFVITPDGMGPNRNASMGIETYLEQTGWIARKPSVEGFRDKAVDLTRSIYRFLPYEARQRIGKRRPRSMIEAPNPFIGVDWSQTRAFPLPHDNAALFRLNLKGREPAGIVDPGDYDVTIKELSDQLSEMIVLDDGRHPIARIARMDEVLGGPIDGAFPDVAVLWDDDPIEKLGSRRFGDAPPPAEDPRTGNHPPTGFLIASGGGVPRDGGLFEAPRALLTDVSATILALLGIDIPGELTGSPIRSIAT